MIYEISLDRIDYKLFLCLTENEEIIDRYGYIDRYKYIDVDIELYNRYVKLSEMVEIWYKELNEIDKFNIVNKIINRNIFYYFVGERKSLIFY